jgi:hypothetical protein
MGHSTVVKSQACLAESMLRSIPVISPCDLSAVSVDFQAGTLYDAWVAEVTGSVAGLEVTECGRSEARSGRYFKLAPLNFVRIRIVDSGSKLNVMSSDLVSELPLESIGEVSLKGVVGAFVYVLMMTCC